MQVDFYNLAAAPVDRVLGRIAERLLSSGERLLIVAEDEALLARLDRQLWDYAPASFLPHARDGGDADMRQPVLLSRSIVAANGSRNVAMADGVWHEAALDYDRAFFLFGEERIAPARESWRALAGREDVVRKFWRQDEDGRWQEGP